MDPEEDAKKLDKIKSFVKEELADVLVNCQNLADKLGLDIDEIINSKMAQNEAKYPVEKAKGNEIHSQSVRRKRNVYLCT